MGVRLLCAHDQDWFRALYHENYRPLLAFARRRVDRVTADEVVADTFLTAWRRRDAVPDGQERPWLFGVARNTIRNALRTARRQTTVKERLRGLPQLAVDDPAVEAGDERAAVLRSALDRLSESDREILMLVAWEELSYADIGLVLGLTPNAAAIRVHRARKRLAEQTDRLSGRFDRMKDPSGDGHTPEESPPQGRRAL